VAKHNTKKERNKVEPFLMIKTWELKSAAFLALTGDEARVYIAARMRYNGSNNGYIVFGTEAAGKAIHKSKSVGARALKRLIELNFLKVTADSSFDQKRLCRTFEITAIDKKPAMRGDRLPDGSMDFMQWTDKKIRALDKRKKAEKLDLKKTKHSSGHDTHSNTHATTLDNVIEFEVK